MITKEDFLKPFFAFNGNTSNLITHEIEVNISQYLIKINKFFYIYKDKLLINSGLRSVSQNKACGGAKHSKHLLGLACDFSDINHKLVTFCQNNLDILEDIGFWMEDPRQTPTWCHLQIVAPVSKRRIF